MTCLFRPVAVLLALLAAGTASAAAQDPLASIPESAQVVVKVDSPRKLAEAITALEAFQQAQQLPVYRQILDSAAARRAYRILAYFERELGAKWPELLDQLAGGGVAVGFRFGDGAPALVVLQGTDEKQVERAFDLVLKVVDEELTRQGAKTPVVWSAYRGTPTVRIGDAVHAARVGSAVLISTKAEFLHQALDIPSSGKPGASVRNKKSLKDAGWLLPKNPLAMIWVDFASVKQTKETKDFFDATRQDFLQTLVLGSTIDCLRRADYVAAGLYQEGQGFRLALRLPAGRDGLPPEFAFHVPPKGTPGSLPLLEPPGVIYSQSFHLDIGFYWKNRAKLINAQMLKDIETGEKQVSKILPGSLKLGELLEKWGGHHRLVVVNHDKLPYKTEPGLRLPAFGYVTAMRDPQFGKSMDAIIRSGGLIATLQFGLKMTHTEHDGVKIVAYRFPEGKPLAEDTENIRFNFEPCYAVVGDQFVVGSTVEVCKKLIDEVKRTAKLPPSPAVWRGKGFADGGAKLLATLSEPVITNAILRQGVGIEEARQQVADLAAFIRTLGTARIEIDETQTEYRFDIVWEPKK